MEKNKSQISLLELKRLLITIIDYKLPVCFRFRMLGEMWQPSFYRVLKVTEKGVVLNDELRNKTIVIPDLANIVQFELDGRLHTFEPNFHYDLNLAEVSS
jgi:hypothetical protein